MRVKNTRILAILIAVLSLTIVTAYAKGPPIKPRGLADTYHVAVSEGSWVEIGPYWCESIKVTVDTTDPGSKEIHIYIFGAAHPNDKIWEGDVPGGSSTGYIDINPATACYVQFYYIENEADEAWGRVFIIE